MTIVTSFMIVCPNRTIFSCKDCKIRAVLQVDKRTPKIDIRDKLDLSLLEIRRHSHTTNEMAIIHLSLAPIITTQMFAIPNKGRTGTRRSHRQHYQIRLEMAKRNRFRGVKIMESWNSQT